MSLLLSQLSGGGTVTYTYTGSGGFVLSGAAPLSKTKTFTASGGLTFAGSSAVSKSKSWTASGGVTFAGTSTVTITHAPASSGGKTYSGAATTSYEPAPGGTIYTWNPSGGFAFGGASPSQFIPFAPEIPVTGSGPSWARFRRNRSRVQFIPERKPVVREYRTDGGLLFGGTAEVSRTRSVNASIRMKRAGLTAKVSRTFSRESSARIRSRANSECAFVSNGATLRRREEESAILLAIQHFEE